MGEVCVGEGGLKVGSLAVDTAGVEIEVGRSRESLAGGVRYKVGLANTRQLVARKRSETQHHHCHQATPSPPQQQNLHDHQP